MQEDTAANPRFDFGPFAEQPEYVAVNRSLVQRLWVRLPDAFVHVDVATGTGLVPKLILEQCRKLRRVGHIIGIDPNTVSLVIARQTTVPDPPSSVTFIEGRGRDTDVLVAAIVPDVGADSVSIHDALHEIADDDEKRATVEAMTRTLKPGGLFSYNSAFTTVGMTGTAMEWGRWKAAAMTLLGQRRNRDAEAMPVHPPEAYREMFQRAGLTIVHEATDRIVELSRAALEAISRYPAFVDGVFKDMLQEERFSVEEKSRALVAALERLHVTAIRRVWHEILAEKPLAPAPSCE